MTSPRNVPPVMPVPKPAKYAGRCGGCDHWIVMDEPIVWVRGIGTRCSTCCVRLWGTQARVQFGIPPDRPVPEPIKQVREVIRIDPIDRDLVPDHNGTIDVRPKKKPPESIGPTDTPYRRPRTYEELFGPDD